MYKTTRRGLHTVFEPFDTDISGPLFTDSEIRGAMTTSQEDGIFEGVTLRGLLDG